MRNTEFLMDDSSIRNDVFAVENNIERVKNYSLTNSESYGQSYELGNQNLSYQII